MRLEDIAISLYKFLDLIIVTLVGLMIFFNIPSYLIELPYHISLFLLLGILILPIALVWLLLVIAASRYKIVKPSSETIRKTLKLGTEIGELDIFYLKAYMIPSSVVQLPLILLIFIVKMPSTIAKIALIFTCVLLLPLLTPLLSKVLVNPTRSLLLERIFREEFKYKVNFVGLINSNIINAHVIESPIYKGVYVTKASLDLDKNNILCLLAHELYHLKKHNTYLLTTTTLLLISLIYVILSYSLSMQLLTKRQVVGLIIPIFYFSIKFFPLMLMRIFEQKADIFAARIVGHDRYINFLKLLKRYSVSLPITINTHPPIEKRIKRVIMDKRQMS